MVVGRRDYRRVLAIAFRWGASVRRLLMAELLLAVGSSSLIERVAGARKEERNEPGEHCSHRVISARSLPVRGGGMIGAMRLWHRCADAGGWKAGGGVIGLELSCWT